MLSGDHLRPYELVRRLLTKARGVGSVLRGNRARRQHQDSSNFHAVELGWLVGRYVPKVLGFFHNYVAFG